MIVSRQNRWIKDIRRLRRSKAYGSRALLEGPHLLEEALAAGVTVDQVLATPRFLTTAEARRLLPRLPRPPLKVAPELLEELADADSPRGVLALVRLPRPGVEGLCPEAGAAYLFGDRIQDPGNLGALLRVAEAAGATGVILSPGCAHPNHPRTLRGSAGSALRVAVHVATPWQDAQPLFGRVGAERVALVAHGGEDLYRASLGRTLVLLVGGEAGLRPDLLRLADKRVRIPCAGKVESLNLAVAAAVVLFELRRRASVSPAPGPPGSPR